MFHNLVSVRLNRGFMIRKINHIGIAVHSIEEMRPFYEQTLGLPFCGEEVVASQKVRVAFFEVGETRIELLEPTATDSPIAQFMEKKGPGIHHIAFGVDDLDDTLETLLADNVKMIDQEPRAGAHGTRIAFIHPRAAGGVLTELCQPGKESSNA